MKTMKHNTRAIRKQRVSGHSYPPEKGGKGGYISYNKTLTQKARENRKNPTPAEKKLWYEVLGNSGHSYPPDKGGKGGYISYNKTLTQKARENRKNPTPAEKKLWYEVLGNKR